RWSSYSLRGLTQPDLWPDVVQLVEDRNAPFGIRALLLQAVKGSVMAEQFVDALQEISLDVAAPFALRSLAVEALAAVLPLAEWTQIVGRLRRHADADSLRLAIEVLNAISFEVLGDHELVDLVVAYVAADDRLAAKLYAVERRIPLDRIEGVMDQL